MSVIIQFLEPGIFMHTFSKTSLALIGSTFLAGMAFTNSSVHAGGSHGHSHEGHYDDASYDTEVITHSHGNGSTAIYQPVTYQTVGSYNPPASWYGALPSGNSYFGNIFGAGGGHSYLRASYGKLQREVEREAADGNPVAFLEEQTYVGGRFGHLINRNIGLEVRGAFSSDVEQVPASILSSPVSTFTIKNYGAVMARFQRDIGYGVMPYVNFGLGATRSQFRSTFGTTNIDTSQTEIGAAAAIGLEFNFASNLVFGVDYHVMPTSVKGLGVTVGYNF